MNGIINEARRTPALIERLAANGNAPFPSTPAEFAALMRAQRTVWQELVRSTGLEPQ
jgi:tripartite-type tricarboxylate transporter receptor subunit TctC